MNHRLLVFTTFLIVLLLRQLYLELVQLRLKGLNQVARARGKNRSGGTEGGAGYGLFGQ